MKCLGREHSDLEQKGVHVLAISADAPESHARFAKALGLRFDLLTDTDLAVARRYGVFAQTPDGGFAARSVFLVGRDGRLRYVDRDFRIPRTLKGSPLEEAVAALVAADDPLSALSALPEPERSGKLVLGRFVQAVLAEDTGRIEALLHPRFRTSPPPAPSAAPASDADAAKERERFLEAWRRTFADESFAKARLDTVLDVNAAQVLDRASATPEALHDRGAGVRRLAAGLLTDDLLVVVRCAGLAADDGTPVLARELGLDLRKEGDEWRIAGLTGR